MPGQREQITHRMPTATSPASPATGREKLTVHVVLDSGMAMSDNRKKKKTFLDEQEQCAENCMRHYTPISI